ncbi:MAG: MucBP domain-containing protein, partial [Clostridiales bacterium]|nr:MucBP domain-containing protein [Clostridiales bacterium]
GTMPGADIEITVVYRDAAAEGWTLRIRYLLEGGGEAAPDHVQTGLSEGDPYEVASPEIGGKTPDQATVSGTMPGSDVEITVVYRDAAAEEWTLRIRYLLESGGEAAPDYVRTGLKSGDPYEVSSPKIRYMAADRPVVSGTMGEADITVVVTYRLSGGFGGFPGFGGYGGYGGGMGAAEGMEDMGFRVTPGEAFTTIHTSGDRDDSLYGTVPLEADAAPMAVLTLGGEALDISLTAGGGAAEFTAEVREGILILSGADGAWSIGGDALRKLQRSGIDTILLLGGGRAASVPTAGFASGYDYDRLRASGLPSSAFMYAVEPSSGSVAFSANGETHALSADGVRFGTPEEVRP